MADAPSSNMRFDGKCFDLPQHLPRKRFRVQDLKPPDRGGLVYQVGDRITAILDHDGIAWRDLFSTAG